MNYVVTKGLLNGYKTLLFDEGSVLLDDKKAYFSEKILYLQEAMAPVGSATNDLAKVLKGADIKVVSAYLYGLLRFLQRHHASRS